MKKPISLAIGTEVALTNRASPTWASWIDNGDALIVTGVSTGTGCLEYSVNGCSWFNHSHLKWIADPTTRVVNYALRIREDDDDSELEEEDDGQGGYITVPSPKRLVIKRHKDAVKAMKGLKLKRRDEGDFE